MLVKYLLTFFVVLNGGGLDIYAASSPQSFTNWTFIERNEWGARPIVGKRQYFKAPAPFLIIHHSYDPAAAASTQKDCIADMQYIQDIHMIRNGWDDIGYSFAICGDGNVYVGRGYGVVGAHAPSHNNRSIGLLFIGDYGVNLPTPKMLAVAHDFTDFSIRTGYLSKNYIMYGHRQVRKGTECPGDALYTEIQRWPHWRKV